MVIRGFKAFVILCLVTFSVLSFFGCKKKSLGDLTVIKDEILIKDPEAKEIQQVENGSLSRGMFLTYFSEKEINKINTMKLKRIKDWKVGFLFLLLKKESFLFLLYSAMFL